MTEFLRPWSAAFATRLAEPRRFLQVVAGPRQVGKTTLVRQVVESSRLAARFASADEPTLRGIDWIEQQWEAARLMEGAGARASGAVLVLDEIQKISGRSETVKRLWDEDTRRRLGLKVVVLGSAPLLVPVPGKRTLMRNPAPPAPPAGAPPAAAPPAPVPRPGQNTTIGVVATNARLTKVQAQKRAATQAEGSHGVPAARDLGR